MAFPMGGRRGRKTQAGRGGGAEATPLFFANPDTASSTLRSGHVHTYRRAPRAPSLASATGTFIIESGPRRCRGPSGPFLGAIASRTVTRRVISAPEPAGGRARKSRRLPPSLCASGLPARLRVRTSPAPSRARAFGLHAGARAGGPSPEQGGKGPPWARNDENRKRTQQRGQPLRGPRGESEERTRTGRVPRARPPRAVARVGGRLSRRPLAR